MYHVSCIMYYAAIYGLCPHQLPGVEECRHVHLVAHVLELCDKFNAHCIAGIKTAGGLTVAR